MNVPINYVGVLLAALSAMVLGFLWYSPMLFGNTWMKLTGITKKDMTAKKKQMPVTYGGMFITALITAYVLAHILYFSGAQTVSMGLQGGFWVWLGFVATVLFGSVLFEGKPIKLFFINAGYHLVNLLAMGVILVLVK